MRKIPEAKSERNFELFRLVEKKQNEVTRKLKKMERDEIIKKFDIGTSRYYGVLEWCRKQGLKLPFDEKPKF